MYINLANYSSSCSPSNKANYTSKCHHLKTTIFTTKLCVPCKRLVEFLEYFYIFTGMSVMW